MGCNASTAAPGAYEQSSSSESDSDQSDSERLSPVPSRISRPRGISDTESRPTYAQEEADESRVSNVHGGVGKQERAIDLLSPQTPQTGTSTSTPQHNRVKQPPSPWDSARTPRTADSRLRHMRRAALTLDEESQLEDAVVQVHHKSGARSSRGSGSARHKIPISARSARRVTTPTPHTAMLPMSSRAQFRPVIVTSPGAGSSSEDSTGSVRRAARKPHLLSSTTVRVPVKYKRKASGKRVRRMGGRSQSSAHATPRSPSSEVVQTPRAPRTTTAATTTTTTTPAIATPGAVTTGRQPHDAPSEATLVGRRPQLTAAALKIRDGRVRLPPEIQSTVFRSPENVYQDQRTDKVQWRCGQRIGKGSYGVVYLGLNLGTGELMAVKQVDVTPQAVKDRLRQRVEQADLRHSKSKTAGNGSDGDHSASSESSNSTLVHSTTSKPDMAQFKEKRVRGRPHKGAGHGRKAAGNASRQGPGDASLSALQAKFRIEMNTMEREEFKGRLRELEDEIALLQSLVHPNLVRYIGMERVALDSAGKSLSSPSAKADSRTNKSNDLASICKINIFLEYVPGGSIFSLLQKFGPFREEVVRKYAHEILCGLRYLHRKGVMHRDIKGANVLVDTSGNCKLADFGACISLEKLRSKEKHRLQGSPYWMAPEVIRQEIGGRKGPDGRKADIWSLGCTVIEMACGKPPWTSYNTLEETLYAIGSCSKPPTLPPNPPAADKRQRGVIYTQFSDAGRDFVAQCLQLDPRKRFSVEQLLRHEFMKPLANLRRQRRKKLRARQKRGRMVQKRHVKATPEPLSEAWVTLMGVSGRRGGKEPVALFLSQCWNFMDCVWGVNSNPGTQSTPANLPAMAHFRSYMLRFLDEHGSFEHLPAVLARLPQSTVPAFQKRVGEFRAHLHSYLLLGFAYAKQWLTQHLLETQCMCPDHPSTSDAARDTRSALRMLMRLFVQNNRAAHAHSAVIDARKDPLRVMMAQTCAVNPTHNSLFLFFRSPLALWLLDKALCSSLSGHFAASCQCQPTTSSVLNTCAFCEAYHCLRLLRSCLQVMSLAQHLLSSVWSCGLVGWAGFQHGDKDRLSPHVMLCVCDQCQWLWTRFITLGVHVCKQTTALVSCPDSVLRSGAVLLKRLLLWSRVLAGQITQDERYDVMCCAHVASTNHSTSTGSTHFIPVRGFFEWNTTLFACFTELFQWCSSTVVATYVNLPEDKSPNQRNRSLRRWSSGAPMGLAVYIPSKVLFLMHCLTGTRTPNSAKDSLLVYLERIGWQSHLSPSKNSAKKMQKAVRLPCCARSGHCLHLHCLLDPSVVTLRRVVEDQWLQKAFLWWMRYLERTVGPVESHRVTYTDVGSTSQSNSTRRNFNTSSLRNSQQSRASTHQRNGSIAFQHADNSTAHCSWQSAFGLVRTLVRLHRWSKSVQAKFVSLIQRVVTPPSQRQQPGGPISSKQPTVLQLNDAMQRCRALLGDVCRLLQMGLRVYHRVYIFHTFRSENGGGRMATDSGRPAGVKHGVLGVDESVVNRFGEALYFVWVWSTTVIYHVWSQLHQEPNTSVFQQWSADGGPVGRGNVRMLLCLRVTKVIPGLANHFFDHLYSFVTHGLRASGLWGFQQWVRELLLDAEEVIARTHCSELQWVKWNLNRYVSAALRRNCGLSTLLSDGASLSGQRLSTAQRYVQACFDSSEMQWGAGLARPSWSLGVNQSPEQCDLADTIGAGDVLRDYWGVVGSTVLASHLPRSFLPVLIVNVVTAGQDRIYPRLSHAEAVWRAMEPVLQQVEQNRDVLKRITLSCLSGDYAKRKHSNAHSTTALGWALGRFHRFLQTSVREWTEFERQAAAEGQLDDPLSQHSSNPNTELSVPMVNHPQLFAQTSRACVKQIKRNALHMVRASFDGGSADSETGDEEFQTIEDSVMQIMTGHAVPSDGELVLWGVLYSVMGSQTSTSSHQQDAEEPTFLRYIRQRRDWWSAAVGDWTRSVIALFPGNCPNRGDDRTLPAHTQQRHFLHSMGLTVPAGSGAKERSWMVKMYREFCPSPKRGTQAVVRSQGETRFMRNVTRTSGFLCFLSGLFSLYQSATEEPVDDYEDDTVVHRDLPVMPRLHAVKPHIWHILARDFRQSEGYRASSHIPEEEKEVEESKHSAVAGGVWFARLFAQQACRLQRGLCRQLVTTPCHIPGTSDSDRVSSNSSALFTTGASHFNLQVPLCGKSDCKECGVDLRKVFAEEKSAIASQATTDALVHVALNLGQEVIRNGSSEQQDGALVTVLGRTAGHTPLMPGDPLSWVLSKLHERHTGASSQSRSSSRYSSEHGASVLVDTLADRLLAGFFPGICLTGDPLSRHTRGWQPVLRTNGVVGALRTRMTAFSFAPLSMKVAPSVSLQELSRAAVRHATLCLILTALMRAALAALTVVESHQSGVDAQGRVVGDDDRWIGVAFARNVLVWDGEQREFVPATPAGNWLKSSDPETYRADCTGWSSERVRCRCWESAMPSLASVPEHTKRLLQQADGSQRPDLHPPYAEAHQKILSNLVTLIRYTCRALITAVGDLRDVLSARTSSHDSAMAACFVELLCPGVRSARVRDALDECAAAAAAVREAAYVGVYLDARGYIRCYGSPGGRHTTKYEPAHSGNQSSRDKPLSRATIRILHAGVPIDMLSRTARFVLAAVGRRAGGSVCGEALGMAWMLRALSGSLSAHGTARPSSRLQHRAHTGGPTTVTMLREIVFVRQVDAFAHRGDKRPPRSAVSPGEFVRSVCSAGSLRLLQFWMSIQVVLERVLGQLSPNDAVDAVIDRLNERPRSTGEGKRSDLFDVSWFRILSLASEESSSSREHPRETPSSHTLNARLSRAVVALLEWSRAVQRVLGCPCDKCARHHRSEHNDKHTEEGRASVDNTRRPHAGAFIFIDMPLSILCPQACPVVNVMRTLGSQLLAGARGASSLSERARFVQTSLQWLLSLRHDAVWSLWGSSWVPLRMHTEFVSTQAPSAIDSARTLYTSRRSQGKTARMTDVTVALAPFGSVSLDPGVLKIYSKLLTVMVKVRSHITDRNTFAFQKKPRTTAPTPAAVTTVASSPKRTDHLTGSSSVQPLPVPSAPTHTHTGVSTAVSPQHSSRGHAEVPTSARGERKTTMPTPSSTRQRPVVPDLGIDSDVHRPRDEDDVVSDDQESLWSASAYSDYSDAYSDYTDAYDSYDDYGDYGEASAPVTITAKMNAGRNVGTVRRVPASELSSDDGGNVSQSYDDDSDYMDYSDDQKDAAPQLGFAISRAAVVNRHAAYLQRMAEQQFIPRRRQDHQAPRGVFQVPIISPDSQPRRFDYYGERKRNSLQTYDLSDDYTDDESVTPDYQDVVERDEVFENTVLALRKQLGQF